MATTALSCGPGSEHSILLCVSPTIDGFSRRCFCHSLYLAEAFVNLPHLFSITLNHPSNHRHLSTSEAFGNLARSQFEEFESWLQHNPERIVQLTCFDYSSASSLSDITPDQPQAGADTPITPAVLKGVRHSELTSSSVDSFKVRTFPLPND